jgi:hypothetical protein
VLEALVELGLDLGLEGCNFLEPCGGLCAVVEDAISTGPHCVGDRKKLADQGSLPSLDSATGVAGLEVHLLYLGPLETNLAQEEIFPPNEILILCSWQGGGISRRAKEKGLMRGEGGYEAGMDGRVGLNCLEPQGKLGNCCVESCRHPGVLAGDHMPSGFGAMATAGAEVIVPLFTFEHHVAHGRMATCKLRNPQAV